MGKSSKDKRDAYYRLAKEQGWRARSAFKLLQLDEEFNLFADVTRVVDLCAAPGSWSQVLSRVLIRGEKFGRATWEDREEKLRQHLLEKSAAEESDSEAESSDSDELPQQELPEPRTDIRIVAIDLQPMSPLQGITTLRADITHPATISLLLHALDPTYTPTTAPQHAQHPVDLVISDGAPDVTGLHDLDIYVQSQLLFAALNLALCVLKPGGKFVAKIFRGRNVDLLFAQMKLFFERVIVSKPRASRASSVEAFIVCLNFRPPSGFRASLSEPLGVGDRLSDMYRSSLGIEPITAPIVLQDRISGAWGSIKQPSANTREDGIIEVEMGSSKFRDGTRWIAPFLASGDLSAFDADASYHLAKDRVSLNPIQPPTAPPYKRALEMRKVAGGTYGKTATL